jgi:histidyl-tRNA synthetase
VLPEEQVYWRYVESVAQRTAASFGYERIDTPVIEDTRLFVRGIGEVTDIVEKETYTFEDRGGDLLTLRPEGTASVCRAYLEHGMHNRSQPVRLHYFCPMFRYERPQSGRYREFHQFGIEALGDADPSVDAEIMELGWRLLDSLGLKNLTLRINSIGDAECRPGYIERLQDHYRPYADVLCRDCTKRLEANPLRLLDCKEDSCQPAKTSAPRSVDHLCDACGDHWTRLLGYLEIAGLPFEIDHRMARGFDYYTRTVFEIEPPVEGSQSTVMAGGRYDGLIEELGGRPTPGIGFGMGMERVIENLKRQEIALPDGDDTKVLVAALGEGARLAGITLCSELRTGGIAAVLGPAGRSLKGLLRYASSIRASHAVIIGERELESGSFVLRNFADGEQSEVPRNEVLRKLSAAHT